MVHGAKPNSGNGSQKIASDHGFHFRRSALPRLKPSLEWWARWPAHPTRTRCEKRWLQYQVRSTATRSTAHVHHSSVGRCQGAHSTQTTVNSTSVRSLKTNMNARDTAP